MAYPMYNKWTNIIVSVLLSGGCIGAGIFSLNNRNTLVGALLFVCLVFPLLFLYEMYNNVLVIDGESLRFFKLGTRSFNLSEIEGIEFGCVSNVSGFAGFILHIGGQTVSIRAGFSASSVKCNTALLAIQEATEKIKNEKNQGDIKNDRH